MDITPPPVIRQKRKTNPWIFLIVLGGFLIFAYGALSMFWGYMFPSVSERNYAAIVPETRSSLKSMGLSGFVLSERRGQLIASSDAGERLLFQEESGWRIHGLCGPNQNGLVALLEIEQLRNLYRFRTLNFREASSTVSKVRDGNVIWDHVVGKMALHPTRPVVAFFAKTSSHQFNDPMASVSVGDLKEIDLEADEVRTVSGGMIDEVFAYHPSGKSIFCIRLTAKKKLSSSQTWGPSEIWNSRDEDAPAVCELDRESGTTKVIGLGWSCWITQDQKDLIAYPHGSQALDGGPFRKFEPGDVLKYRWPVMFLSRKLVLASALPTRKEDVRFFPWTGSISGRHQMMRLGLFNIETNDAFIPRTDLDRYEDSTFVPADYEPKPISSGSK